MAGQSLCCASPQAGEWVKGKVVGSGSFGTVHLAMNKINGALFVVKSAEFQAGVESLENEAKMLEKLSSPHVVKCIGREVSNGANGLRKLNLFIEYMAGGSLADVAEKFGGILDEKVVRLYTRGILQGLKYLHKNGIVHCDLKCKNVLLDSSGNIKLADFGCAKRPKDTKGSEVDSVQSHIVGTPLWMAPEVLRNVRVDFAADIWSLGCTIIEMATGTPPWGGSGISNPMAAVLKIACSDDRPQFPRHFSSEGLDFLEKCLARDPRRRWTSEELLKHPFVLGKSEENSFIKADVHSPTSVLDDGIFEEGLEPEVSPHQNVFASRFPFSISCYGERENISHTHRTKKQLMASDKWVTVRSG